MYVCFAAIGFVDPQGSVTVPETHPAQPGTSFSTVQTDPQPQHTMTHPQSMVRHFLSMLLKSSLVIPNSATSLCFVDRVWHGIIEKRFLSRGGRLSEV